MANGERGSGRTVWFLLGSLKFQTWSALLVFLSKKQLQRILRVFTKNIKQHSAHPHFHYAQGSAHMSYRTRSLLSMGQCGAAATVTDDEERRGTRAFSNSSTLQLPRFTSSLRVKRVSVQMLVPWLAGHPRSLMTEERVFLSNKVE